jgi:voltage-gated potassium channel
MKNNSPSLKHRLHEIIYEADTPAGKLFDIVLLFLILFSVVLVMLESVSWIGEDYAELLYQLEWGITVLFSLEYLTRLLVVKKPWRYVTSFFGIIDLLSLLPMYISFFFMGTSSLVALRALRLLRVFRILKLSRYIGESNFLMAALWASRAKIGVFLFAVIILCVIFGTIMYLVEGEANGFSLYPAWDLLVHRHPNDCGLWRHCPHDPSRSIYRFYHYDYGIWHYCCSHRNCHLGNDTTTPKPRY